MEEDLVAEESDEGEDENEFDRLQNDELKVKAEAKEPFFVD